MRELRREVRANKKQLGEGRREVPEVRFARQEEALMVRHRGSGPQRLFSWFWWELRWGMRLLIPAGSAERSPSRQIADVPEVVWRWMSFGYMSFFWWDGLCSSDGSCRRQACPREWPMPAGYRQRDRQEKQENLPQPTRRKWIRLKIRRRAQRVLHRVQRATIALS